MKRLFRVSCMLLVVAILVAMPAFAAESSPSRSSNYFMSSSVYLDEVTTYTFKACFLVTAVRNMDVLGASEIKIQRSADGVNWTTTKTFTKEDYPSLVDEEQTTHGADVNYTGTKGYYYRAKITLYAKDSSGVAEATAYTSKIKIGG